MDKKKKTILSARRFEIRDISINHEPEPQTLKCKTENILNRADCD